MGSSFKKSDGCTLFGLTIFRTESPVSWKCCTDTWRAQVISLLVLHEQTDLNLPHLPSGCPGSCWFLWQMSFHWPHWIKLQDFKMIPHWKCLYNDFFLLSWLNKAILAPGGHPVILQSKAPAQQVHFAEKIKLYCGVGVRQAWLCLLWRFTNENPSWPQLGKSGRWDAWNKGSCSRPEGLGHCPVHLGMLLCGYR